MIVPNRRGYVGNSMSERASEAYDRGLRPLSKWTKKDILTSMYNSAIPQSQIAIISVLDAATLKKYALRKTEWHHTSSAFNRTTFYGIDTEWCRSVTSAEIKSLQKRTSVQPIKLKEEKWEAEWDEAHKVRGRWKYETKTAIGMLRGDWFYLPDGSKKDIKGKHFTLKRRVD